MLEGHLEYVTNIWDILWPFGTLLSGFGIGLILIDIALERKNLVHFWQLGIFMAFWYILTAVWYILWDFV
jgi:hypothetical protein